MSIITNNLNLIVDTLKYGAIAVIPTETVYGLAGNANDTAAINKIYALKKRPLEHPLIMHIAQGWDLSIWAKNIPEYVEKLITQFWPGPLTLVLPCNMQTVNPMVTAGQTTIAIRCPQHPLTQKILIALAEPLVMPSANVFSKLSPTTAVHVQANFSDSDLLILDGGRCDLGIESTIINATLSESYQILRHGSINQDALQQCLPNIAINKQELDEIRVSGRLKNHYQPQKPLYVFTNKEKMQTFASNSINPYILSVTKDQEFAEYLGYQLPIDSKVLAYELYYRLWLADNSSASMIIMEMPPEGDVWQGVRERILKAASNIEDDY